MADHDNHSLSNQTAEALLAALKIGCEIDILVLGKGAEAGGDEAPDFVVRTTGSFSRLSAH